MRFLKRPTKISLVFCQCKRLLENLAGIIRVFGHVDTWPSALDHPTAARDVMRTTRLRVKAVERSRACRTTYQNIMYEIQVFSLMCFSCQKPRMLWVFLAV